uniref:Uncharacterized protein n=1 Tax=Cacopsylla melanoneura TaxID=428564 RepID=A0A8D8Z191_9HEMI
MSFPAITLDNTVIPLVDHARNLGVIIDNTLSWSAHIKQVRQKVFYCLYTLGKFRRLFPVELKRKLAQALVFPHFDYCDIVYGDLNVGLGGSLQVAQNACVRFVYNH